MKRRKFLRQSSLAAAGLLTLQLPRIGFARQPYHGVLNPVHNIPAIKNIDPAWLQTLYKRGHPTTYSKQQNELQYIGMPAGGLHTGTVYMGGDGRLWLWGIYNDEREGVDPKTLSWYDGHTERTIRNRDGASYLEPAIAANKRVLEQGFAIQIKQGTHTWLKELKEEDWQQVTFEATYPTALIRFSDPNCPVDVIMHAGGLFIPLDADNSALPATIFDINIQNKTTEALDVNICGWFENGARKMTAKPSEGIKRNTVLASKTGILSTFQYATGVPNHPDDGSTCITCIGDNIIMNTNADIWPVTNRLFSSENKTTDKPADEILVAAISTATTTIEANKALQIQYALTWHFNHPLKSISKVKDAQEGYYYGSRFQNAGEVATYIHQHFNTLWSNTLLWKETFYDSTLPFWFLERTFLNIGTLATANTYRFKSGRFWGWEGVNSCAGTCTHVWQYAQTVGRIFPSLERDTRQHTDLGIAMDKNGGIIFRAEYENRPAIDGQAGTILRIYREHLMNADNSFLAANWTQIKKTVIFMLAQDKNNDGMTDTPMENTLDAVWEGEISWIVGLCIAAAKAAQLMAEEMKDSAFAKQCKEYADNGGTNMSKYLFNGEYFIHRPDAVQGRKKLGSYNTCHIDQVYGQSWAWQVGLGRLWDKEQTLAALRALWKYNFTTNVGPYIKTHIGGRPYALDGEAGMIMNTNPHNEANPYGEDVTWQLGYFHECMSGFEHQVASHMMAEGMTDEALILTRAIHDRYHGAKRNPFNEIECSDHYARAMASYGTFITACGYEYHGPKGILKFKPAFSGNDFRAPFTTAEGWGTFSQLLAKDKAKHTVALKYGVLKLNTLNLDTSTVNTIKQVNVKIDNREINVSWKQHEQQLIIHFPAAIQLAVNEVLTVASAS
ncbi:GH116 family glycosyl-hydrolase [Chitinophaga sp. Hz27]|uniref:GH116 family glycosyl-hydrolase n=1 Tax=Chitinophaga sp. Hz27 TaxID=3347169 RepID=UPI0035DDD582